VSSHPLRIHLDLEHLEPLAPDGDIRHAGYGEEALPDGPVGDHREVDH
jgi:hypothetical protein